MGKLGSIIATAVFMAVFAMFVYYCCLNKRRRDSLRNRAQSFFRQAESSGEGQQQQPQVHVHGGGGGGYPSSVPHSIVNPNQPFSSPYPQQHQSYPAYPGYGGHSNQTTPYPPGPPGGMPMPIAYDHRQMASPGFQDPSAPVITYPDDLPPPYSQIAGQKY